MEKRSPAETREQLLQAIYYQACGTLRDFGKDFYTDRVHMRRASSTFKDPDDVREASDINISTIVGGFDYTEGQPISISIVKKYRNPHGIDVYKRSDFEITKEGISPTRVFNDWGPNSQNEQQSLAQGFRIESRMNLNTLHRRLHDARRELKRRKRTSATNIEVNNTQRFAAGRRILAGIMEIVDRSQIKEKEESRRRGPRS